MATRADESGTGPASFVVVDPDGNPVLVDQHVCSKWVCQILLRVSRPSSPYRFSR